MAYDDLYRLSVHAVFTDSTQRILQLKSTYNGNRWGLPGGSLEPRETVHQALVRECREELGVEIKVLYCSGIYYHQAYNSHACIFRCEFLNSNNIILSSEHSEYRYFTIDELSEIQRIRILDCLNFKGNIKSASF